MSFNSIKRMHENNAKVFLLTNSGYEYTDVIIILEKLLFFLKNEII